MPLSKQTTDQIRKEAKEYRDGWGNGDDAESYRAGATTWAVWKEKAEGYEKALKEVYEQLDDKDIPMATRFLNAGQIIEITLNNSNK